MEDLLEKLNVNPYDFLKVEPSSSKIDIKKAYKKRAMVLHPDKTRGRTEAEFKILVLCYKYAVKNCTVTSTSTFEEIKNVDRTEEQAHDREFHSTNFEDQKTRNEIYVEDDINFDEFEKHMKRIQGMSTSYSPESFYKKDIMDSMKSEGVFDKNKFNAYFLKLRKDNKIENQLMKKETLKAFNEDDKYMSVNIYEDMVINLDNTKQKGNYRDLMKQSELSQADIDSVLQTDLKTINKLVKEHNKDTGKISRKKLKELASKKSKNVSIPSGVSFAQMGARIDLENIERRKRETAEQRKHVEANMRIFSRRIT